MSIQVNRSCSRYITSMATLRLRWTSSQVITVTPYTHVPVTDQPLVTDTTCTYRATLQATAIPTPIVVTNTSCPLGTLHLVLPVDFMQVDPVPTSLPLMLRCFTRQLKYCLSVDHDCHTYPLPSEYSASGHSCRFYAVSYKFTPTDVEVFYETTT